MTSIQHAYYIITVSVSQETENSAWRLWLEASHEALVCVWVSPVGSSSSAWCRSVFFQGHSRGCRRHGLLTGFGLQMSAPCHVVWAFPHGGYGFPQRESSGRVGERNGGKRQRRGENAQAGRHSLLVA